MRGIFTSVTDLRRKVFTEVARMAYEGGDYARKIEELPFRILPGERANYRTSIFLERAIIGERLRLAIGLPLRKASECTSLSSGIEESAIAEKYYDAPLINVIKFACNSCDEKKIFVSDGCRGCLAHPCTEVCPVHAVSIQNGKSIIDQESCIKCGRCKDICQYQAIIKQERPCAAACGMDAIGTDEFGRAEIDQNKCVSCGMCLVNCPFGAIVDKGQIFQTIHAIKEGYRVYAAVAPAFVGQFGPKVTPGKLRKAMKELGFYDVVEVAVGADLCATDEAKDFIENVPDKHPFMATSCCPAWSVMAKKLFPDLKKCISMTMTPMVLTGRLIKMQNPDAKVVFVGPCAAKKLEASRKSVRSDIDFVLTFEEMMGFFHAKAIDLENIEEEKELSEASRDGRNFAISGGVAEAVANCIKELYPEKKEDIRIEKAQGLRDCRKLLMLAKTGKYNGYLLEGMACPGGCVAGAGTLQMITKSTDAVKQYAKDAEYPNCYQNTYLEHLDTLNE